MAERVWTVGAALDWTRGYLADRGDEHPRLSAEWLLSASTGLSRVSIYAQFDRPLSADERVELKRWVRRRASGEPLQYVTGEVAFRHIVLKVRPGVLIPRPETEVLVDEALAAIEDIEHPRVLDVCTGSGCIALSIAREHASAIVWAGDVSADAVACAAENAARLGLTNRVDVAESDLFAQAPVSWMGTASAVVANPPYIPSDALETLPAEVARYEPRLALDGGADGLSVYRRILELARAWLAPGGMLAVELDESRVKMAAGEAQEWYEEVRVVPDLAGRDRVVTARRKMRP